MAERTPCMVERIPCMSERILCMCGCVRLVHGICNGAVTRERAVTMAPQNDAELALGVLHFTAGLTDEPDHVGAPYQARGALEVSIAGSWRFGISR